jgi:hypothetical protein
VVYLDLTPREVIEQITLTPTAPAKVGGGSEIVVTLAPPAGETVSLSTGDFAAMEATESLAVTSVVETEATDDAAWELTVTASADLTEDSSVTVTVSPGSSDKYALASPVSVTVDRTGPNLEIAVPATEPKATEEVIVTVPPGLSLGDVTVTYTTSDNTQSVLPHTYNSTSGDVKFTPPAAGTVIITIAAGVSMDEFGNSNVETTSGALLIGDAPVPRAAVAVTATAAAATVNGSTPIVITISATAPAMVPDDLEAADFTVMEGEDALTPTWNATDSTLTITPAGTGDTTVTVAPSTAGMDKISFAEASVIVDRTAPVVTIGDPAPTPVKVDVSTTVSIIVDEAGLSVASVSIMQGTVVPRHTYENGVLTFTPTEVGTVIVSVAADAVEDAVGNGNEPQEIEIDVSAVDPGLVDTTPPTVTITGTQGTSVMVDRTAPVVTIGDPAPTPVRVGVFTTVNITVDEAGLSVASVSIMQGTVVPRACISSDYSFQ